MTPHVPILVSRPVPGRPAGATGRGATSRLASALVAAILVTAATPARAFELGDLFRNAEQRAAARLEDGDHEAVVADPPDARWEGLGRYAGGDAEGAADAFARALEPRAGGTAPTGPERDELLYNRATAATRAGRLDEAIALYDELLARDPEHADGRHNRDVARSLRALEERDRDRNAGGGEGRDDGEEGGERADGGGSSEPGGGTDAEAGADGAGAEAGERESGERGGADERDAAGDAAGASAADGSGDGAAADEEAADEAARAAAEAALEAERREDGRAGAGDAADGAGTGTEDGVAIGGDTARTPTEREQATEQWLRQIADDPSGLLRRRLARSHRGDYPEVGDSDEPW